MRRYASAMALDHAELLRHLEEQQGFLEASCAGFDAGNLAEAKRIAIVVRVLVQHVERSSHALLHQLGVLESQPWPCVNAAPVDPAAAFAFGGMYSFGLTAVAKTTMSGREVPFEEWWNEAVTKSVGVLMTRSSVIRDLANKGGGGHVDPRPNNSYRAIAEGPGVGIEMWTDDGAAPRTGADVPLNNPMPQIARAVGAEVLEFVSRVLAKP